MPSFVEQVASIVEYNVVQIWEKNPDQFAGCIRFAVRLVEMATLVSLARAGGPKYVQESVSEIDHPFPLKLYEHEVQAHAIISKRGGIYESLFLNIVLRTLERLTV